MDHETIRWALVMLACIGLGWAYCNALREPPRTAFAGLKRRERSLVLCSVAGIHLCALTVSAVRPSFQSDPEYILDYWETEEGLPENSATAMVQTAEGYLWFGTFNGLVRFDGVKFTVFNQENTPQLPSSSVVNLHLDKQGRLWISTYGGLVVHDGTRWDVLTREDVSSGEIIRSFAERPNGDLLLTKFNGKIAEFSNGRLRDLPSPPGDPQNGYFGQVDESGHWWVVQYKFIGWWDGNQWVAAPVALDFSALASDQFGCAKARDGGLWIILGSELLKYSRGAEVARVHLPELPGGVWSMEEDSQGNLWVSTHDKGVCRISPNCRLRRWNEGTGLPYHGASFVFEDRESDLWVGRSGGGLARFKPRRFQSFGPESGLSESVVKSVWPAHGGGLWIATYGQGLLRLGSVAITNVPIPGWDRDLHGQSVLTDRAGRTWVGTYRRGFWILDGEKVRRIPDDEAGGDNVIALFENSKARVWTSGGRAVSAFTDGIPQCFGPEQGLPPLSVRCFGEDRDGTVWLSNLRAVFRLKNEGVVEVQDSEHHPIRDIICIRGDREGRLWMGSLNAGLFCWRDGALSKIGVSAGLPASSIHDIIEDEQGFFWMTSNRGIIRAHPDELASVADGNSSKVFCQLLDLGDGLPSVEFPMGEQPACARDPAGRLWFATTKGITVTDPANFRLRQQPVSVQIEEVIYHVPREGVAEGGRRVAAPLADHLELPPGSRRIEIHYTAPCLAAPEKVRFEVKPEGQNAAWEGVGSQRVAYFDQLRPGKHSFRVRACNSDGVWNHTAANLEFTALPLFWQTTWFRTLEWSAAVVEALLIVGLLTALAQRRQARLALRERLHFEQLVSELSGMFINLPVEKMDAQITTSLARVAESLRFDAASLEVFKGSLAEAPVVFRWHDNGVEQDSPDLSEKSLPCSLNQLLQDRVVAVPRLEEMPAEARVDQGTYQRSGLRSVYHVPLSVGGIPSGALSLCTVWEERALPAELLERQRLIAEVFANALTRRFAENRRRESEAKFLLAVDTSPSAIILADGNGQIVLANPQTEKLFGYESGELIGEPVERLMSERFHESHAAQRQEFMTSPQAREMGKGRLLIARRKDGTEFEAEIGLNPIAGKDRILVLTTIVDVTEKRKKDLALRESEERMSLAAEAANLGMWMWDIRENTVWATEKFRTLFGFGLHESFDVEAIQGRVHSEDRAGRESALQRALDGEGTYYVEYRLLLLPGGEERWITSKGRAEFDSNGKPVRMLGVCIDVTERRRMEEEAREVSGRLITAQEGERTRLARELHDDLSQSLALLSVDLDLFGQQQPPDRGDSARLRMEELANQVRNLSSEVHRLSHELHPSKLEQLGLVAAVRSFCKDIMAAHGIAIEFLARGVPQGMPGAVALCLYRVAQEAIQNMVKHSGATHTRVELSRSSGNGVCLTITDDGAGFDLKKARGNGSLGLVSMRERVRTVQGRLRVESSKGRGTKVEVLIPVDRL